MSRFDWLITSYPILRWISQQLDRRFTTGGKVVLIAALFFAAGSTHLDSPVYLLLASTITLLFIALVMSVYYRPALKLDVKLPDFAVAQEEANLLVHVRNGGERTAVDLDFYIGQTGSDLESNATEKSPVNVQRLERNRAHSVALPLVGRSRGLKKCPEVTYKTAYPFYLLHSKTNLKIVDQLPVVPKFHPLKSIEFITNPISDRSGDQNRSMALADQEFVGSREYVPGIATRRWDYSAWARLGVPYVCQFEDEGAVNAMLVFDPKQTKNDPALYDAAISLYLSIIESLQDNQILIDSLIIADRTIDATSMSNSNLWKEACFELATIHPNKDFALLAPERIQLGNQMVIVVTTNLDDRIDGLKSDFQHENCSCLIVHVVHEPTISDDSSYLSVTTNEIHSGAVHL